MAELRRHTLWTELDEQGVIINLPRHPDETNHEYIRRLKQRMEWKPGTTPQGLINALSVEFGLTPYYKENKQFFYLTHSPENLDEKVTTFSDFKGNATVNGELTEGTLRVFVDASGGVDGNPFKQYGEYSSEAAPSGWIFPSGYVPNTSGYVGYGDPGYIIWRDDEGRYTNILEFLFWTPPTDAEVRVEYVYRDVGNTHQYFSDFSNPDNPLDKVFLGISGHDGDPSKDIRIYNTDYLTMDGGSLGRRELAQRLRNLYGHTWNTFKWGDYVWGNADVVGSGSIPTYYDAEIQQNYTEYMGGVGSEEDLLVNCELSIAETIWRPQVKGGTFFLGNIPFHLYEDKRSTTLLTGTDILDLSDAHYGKPITVTELTGLPTRPSGLIENATRLYGYHPSGNQTSWAWKQIPNLSGLDGIDQFTWSPTGQEFWMSNPDWSEVPISGVAPSMNIRVHTPSGLGTNLNVDYEANTISGVGSIINVDVNPTNSYMRRNKFLVIDDESTAFPEETDGSGTASGGTAVYLVDSSKLWTENEWVGRTARITDVSADPDVIVYAEITRNDATTLHFEKTGPGFTIASGDTYVITFNGYLTIYSRTKDFIGQGDVLKIGGHLVGANGDPIRDALVTIDVSGAQGHVVDWDGGWQDYEKYTSSDGSFRFDYLVQDITESHPYRIKVTTTKSLDISNYIDINHPSGT